MPVCSIRRERSGGKQGRGRGFAHSELVGVDVDAKQFWQADCRRHSRNLDPYECQRPLIPFAIGKLPPLRM
jgi:hypothetical protein